MKWVKVNHEGQPAYGLLNGTKIRLTTHTWSDILAGKPVETTAEINRETAVLINTARGGIVVESDLIHALKKGVIGGAGLDCFETEPLPEDSPLLRLDGRLILTPHVGGMTREALARMGHDAVDTQGCQE